MILILSAAVLILAGYGAWSLVVGTFTPWHWLIVPAGIGLIVLAVKLGCVEIDNWCKGPPK